MQTTPLKHYLSGIFVRGQWHVHDYGGFSVQGSIINATGHRTQACTALSSQAAIAEANAFGEAAVEAHHRSIANTPSAFPSEALPDVPVSSATDASSYVLPVTFNPTSRLLLQEVGSMEQDKIAHAQLVSEDNLAASKYEDDTKRAAIVDDAAPLGDAAMRQMRVDSIRIISKIDEAEEGRSNACLKLTDAREVIMKKLERLQGDEATKEATSKSQADTEALYQTALQYLELGCRAKLSGLKHSMSKVEAPQQVVTARSDLALAIKSFTAGPVKEFHSHVRALNLSVQSSLRRSATGAKATRAGKPAATKSELAKAVEVMGEHNVTLSVFEAKGGVRLCKMPCESEDKFQALLSTPLIKKGLARIERAIKQGSLTAVQDKLEPSKAQASKFETTLVRAVGTELRSRRALPAHLEWAPKVYGFRLHGTSESTEVSWTHFGLMEAIVFFEGTGTFLGLRTEHISGASYFEKRETVMRMSGDTLARSVQNHGWLLQIKDGTAQDGCNIAIVPSGFLLVSVCSGIRCLRWSLSSDDQDLRRAQATMVGVLESFAEFRNPEIGMAQFSKLLAASGSAR